MIMKETKYITRYAYAKKWKTSLPTIYNHVKKGRFPASALLIEGDMVLIDAEHPFKFSKAGRPSKKA